MAKEPTQDIRLSIEVPVSASEYAYLEANAGGKPPSEKLAAYTKWLFARQAGGGLMLEPADMDYLAGLNKGQRFESSRDVVKCVEIALKREEGQYSFTINIDPTLVQPLEECAGFMGMDSRQLMEICIGQVLQNGWCYEMSPANGRMVPLDEAGLAVAQRVTGKPDFTAADVAKALQRLEALEKAQPQAAAQTKAGKAA